MSVFLKKNRVDALNSVESEKSELPPELIAVRFAPGDTIYNLETAFGGLYLIDSGLVKNEIRVDGNDAITLLSTSDDILGLDSLACTRYVSRATAITSVSAVLIQNETLNYLLRNREEFCMELVEAISKAIAQNVLTARMLSRSRAEARVAFLILKLSTALNSNHSVPNVDFDIGLSRSDIAAHLAITRETLSRKIDLLRALGYVEVRGRRFKICNPNALAEMSNQLCAE